jgi:hypothetical protein
MATLIVEETVVRPRAGPPAPGAPRSSRALSIAVAASGIAFLLIYPLMRLWPSGWAWTPPQSEYEQMIVGVYATLGVFLLRAARRPEENLSLIWFTAWSSIVHGCIMLAQSFADPMEHGHMLGDVPALLLVGVVLAALTPRRRGSARPASKR